MLQGIKEPGAGEKLVNALVGGMADGTRRGQAIAIFVPGLVRERGEEVEDTGVAPR